MKIMARSMKIMARSMRIMARSMKTTERETIKDVGGVEEDR